MNSTSFKLWSLVQLALYYRFYLQSWTQEMLNKNRQILLADPLPPNLRVTLHTPHNPESLWIMTKQVAQYFCGDDADREISGQLSADVVPCLIQAYFKRYPLDAPKDYFQELCGGHPGCFNYVCVEELGSHFSASVGSAQAEAYKQFVVETNCNHLNWLLRRINDESSDMLVILQADSHDQLYRMGTSKSRQFTRWTLRRCPSVCVHKLLEDVVGVVLDNSLFRDDTVSPGIKAGIVQAEIIKQRLTALLHKELFS